MEFVPDGTACRRNGDAVRNYDTVTTGLSLGSAGVVTGHYAVSHGGGMQLNQHARQQIDNVLIYIRDNPHLFALQSPIWSRLNAR